MNWDWNEYENEVSPKEHQEKQKKEIRQEKKDNYDDLDNLLQSNMQYDVTVTENDLIQRAKEIDNKEDFDYSILQDFFEETNKDFHIETQQTERWNTENWEIEDNSLSWNKLNETKRNLNKVSPIVGTNAIRREGDYSVNLHTKFTKKENVDKLTEAGKPYRKTPEEWAEYRKRRHLVTEEDRERAKEYYYSQKPTERAVENPIDNEKTREIVISPSGQTLSEFLTFRRRKKKKSLPETMQEIIAEKKEKEEVKEPWLDDTYCRRVKFLEKQKEKKEKEQKAKNQPAKGDFLSAHARQTPMERQIIKSLGLSTKEVGDLLKPSSELSELEKAKLLSLGYFGNDKVIDKKSKIGQRYFTTIGDVNYLHYLDKFKIASIKTLRLIDGASYRTVYGRMNKMYKLGLVKKVQIYGVHDVWVITSLGAALIGSEKKGLSEKALNPTSLSERFYVNHVGACLYGNRINALNLSDFPYEGRDFLGKFVRGETIITESEILSSLAKEVGRMRGGVFFSKDKFKGQTAKMSKDNWEITWRKWENNGRMGEAPDEKEGNEFLYLLFSDDDLNAKYIVPDLVVKRPRENGKPKSIAIEVERMSRSVDEYIRKLSIYKADNRVYEKVVYVTPHNRTAKLVSEAARKISFDRFDVVPPMDEYGPTKQVSSWLI